jgi:DNA topoisomerase-3
LIAVIAEKPSVARDLAAVLGAQRRRDAVIEGGGYLVSWAIGHLVGLCEPHEMDASWKPWRLERLPMLPAEWPLKALDETREHFDALAKLLNASDVEKVVCATDAGREGELIFRYIYRLAGCRKPVDRLWISSLTPKAIRDGFASLRPWRDFDRLADAAEGRSRADWLVGMNLSRLYTVRFGPDLMSVGRVQTPTLAMLVERERAIERFVPEKYCEVVATFGAGADAYPGTWFDPARAKHAPAAGGEGSEARLAQRLPPDGALAEAIRARCQGASGVIASLSGADRSAPPPLLYDLTELQRHANRLFGLTAKATLEVAQALYEKHKLLSYPRTDSRHLSTAIAPEAAQVARALSARYGDRVAPGTGERPLGRRFVDDARVHDHHAIIPTPVSREGKVLSVDEERLYDLVCRRLLMAWGADHKTRVTQVVTEVATPSGGEAPPIVDRFRSSGTVVTQLGWKALDLEPGRPADRARGPDAERALPPGLAEGQRRQAERVEVLHKETEPPRRFTDATLLTAMESAGRSLDSRELEEAMRERGLGTPATRAAILETLLARGYAERRGKSLWATARGAELIDRVHEAVKSPHLTGEWELALKRLERGEGTLAQFMRRIEQFVIDLVGEVKSLAPASSSLPAPRAGLTSLPPSAVEARPGQAPSAAPPASPTAPRAGLTSLPPPAVEARPGQAPSAPPPAPPVQAFARAAPAPAPAPADSHASGPIAADGPGLARVLRERFGFDVFRPHQEEVVTAVASGENALLVMPTGSGKSLCYQLPGIARGGTTLVISPLIALMEDQTAKLKAMGFRAERVHSGRSREESRAACRAYLDGNLDFLTIAPERLSVPGFPEMLARRRPALVAVDEAHCISHWGHDFRPDYRLLGERLPLLMPAPVLALTATATVRVQDDILAQLGIPKARRFIRGFRRDNLAVEATERPRGERLAEVVAALAQPGRTPAIVYVPTRKLAEEVAGTLTEGHRAAAYHAGLDPSARGRTQEAFLKGELEVIVATIAFGMGIDKPDVRTVIHMALPGTLEGYYQEIGRAGRDGLPARALLLYSFGDRKVHESFLERDYPDISVLEKLRGAVGPAGLDRAALLSRCGLEPERAEAALDKLWIHGGVAVDGEDCVRPGRDGWQASYQAIRAYRQAQLNEMFEFAESAGCRMVRLIRHFGDTRDHRACNQCDHCKPEACTGRSFRAPDRAEESLARRIVEELERFDNVSTGTVYRALFPGDDGQRRHFERMLQALVRAGAVALAEDSFEKEGRTIRFRRVSLQPGARPALASDRFLVEGAAEAGSGRNGAAPQGGPRIRKKSAKGNGALSEEARGAGADPSTVMRLKEWRRTQAKQRGVPAFRILTDRALLAIAAERPSTLAELLQVRGLGPKLVERHGAAILAALA